MQNCKNSLKPCPICKKEIREKINQTIDQKTKEGQEIEKGDTVITLESDKSSVEVPSSISGTVKVVHIKIGDKVSEGSLVASLEGTIESGKINLPDSESKKNIKTLKSQLRYPHISFPS